MANETDVDTRLDERLRAARDRLDRLEERVGQVAEPAVEPVPQAVVPAAAAHVLFVPSAAGYDLMDGEGGPPSSGEIVAVPDRDETFVVTKVGPSPLPGDQRPCAYLQVASVDL